MTQKQGLEKMLEYLEQDLSAYQKDFNITGKEVYRQIADTIKFHISNAQFLLGELRKSMPPELSRQEQREADEFCHNLARELAAKREARK